MVILLSGSPRWSKVRTFYSKNCQTILTTLHLTFISHHKEHSVITNYMDYANYPN